MENLEEGILITSQSGVTYVNQIFMNVIDNDQSFEKKVFKIHNRGSVKVNSSIVRDQVEQEFYSINDFIKET